MNNDMLSKILPMLMGQNMQNQDMLNALGGKDISAMLSSFGGGKDLSGILSLLSQSNKSTTKNKKNFDEFVKVKDYYKQ